ncbi:MAG: molybdopterin-dependent oxidoreductase [Coriobacteriaceae bacterium]|jgi:anaerobic dimethyl sulfoxide reductase subunit A|nr:molybdopterin-dependent oxidoreductase [Coriobacteriaceae bacterium]
MTGKKEGQGLSDSVRDRGPQNDARSNSAQGGVCGSDARSNGAQGGVCGSDARSNGARGSSAQGDARGIGVRSNSARGIGAQGIDRRSFIKATSATALALAGLSAPGCSPQEKASEVGQDVALPDPDEQGEWVPVACWHNCGGRCLNKALVKDGLVIRQKTDDTCSDEGGAYFQNRACPRGRSQQQQCYGTDRLKYPMKRKGWKPGGGANSNGHLRGTDEWERISWDEALDYIASEMRCIYEGYGPRAVFHNGGPGYGIGNVLNSLGGAVSSSSTESYGAWRLYNVEMGQNFVNSNPDMESANDRFDLVNADTIVLYGCNPAWASAGSPSWFYKQAADAGVRFVYVGPSRNVSASMLDARWIPVRPGTDTAFLLAVAFVMIEQGYIDQEFLDKYTVGFDAAHMPEDAVLEENFKDYVLGSYDGIQKDPAWASGICGTTIEDIEWFAQAMAKENNVMLLHSYAAARCNGAENLPQLFMTIGAMGGHMGRSGNATGCTYYYESANSGPRLVRMSYPVDGYVPGKVDDVLCGPVQWKSIVEGSYDYAGGMYSVGASFPPMERRSIDIKMIYSVLNNFTQSRMDINNAIKAHQKMEFVVAQDYKLSLSCQLADIVLPITTEWEGWIADTWHLVTWMNRETQYFYTPVLEEGLFEAKPDRFVAQELAKRLDIDPAPLFPATHKQMYFDQIAGTKVFVGGTLRNTPYGETAVPIELLAKPDPDAPDPEVWEPLAAITQQDIDDFGVVGTPQEGKVPFKELMSKGVYQVGRQEGDGKGWIAYEDFIKDPLKYPRPSKSGKFEIYCQAKADGLNGIGFNPEPIKPYPHYLVPVEGYEASFIDWEAKIPGEYTFQMYTPHYIRRSHTTLDNLPWLQEAFENPVFMNATDAAERGIENGDTVLVSSKWGKILRHASLLQSVMPGCLGVPHGKRTDIDPATGIDRGGSENSLLGPVQSNYYPQLSGYNTCLVKVEKYLGEEIPPDHKVSFVADAQ